MKKTGNLARLEECPCESVHRPGRSGCDLIGWGIKMRRVAVMTVVLGLCHVAVVAADVKVTLSVDQTDMTLEDEATMTVSVESDRSSSDPVFPPMAAFKMVPHGTSSSIQIINGNMKFKKEYTFELIPQNEGAFVVGPVSIFAGGHEYQSNTVAVRVSRDRYSRPPQTIPGPGTPSEPQPPTPGTTVEGETERPYWIETSVSNRDPVVSQQILFTFRFVTSVNVGSPTLSLPEFEGFLSEEVVPEKKYYQEINGTRHVVSEKVVALFPIKAGPVEIGETLLEIEVPQKRDPSPFDDPFFGFRRPTMKRKNLRAPPIALSVKELPSPRPENYSNLVGQFIMNVGLAENEIAVGDSATLSIEITGSGNIKDALLPKSLDFGGMKVYHDKPLVEVVRKEHGLSGEKIFKIALVPVSAGTLALPKISLSYFDPEKGTYETLEGRDVALNVLPSGDQSLGLVGPSPAVGDDERDRGLQEDIATLHTDIRPASRVLNLPTGTPLYYGVLGLPPLIYVVTLLIRRRRERRKKNLGVFREREAYSVLKKRLRDVLKGPDGAARAENILEAIKLYIGDRFHLYGAALTTEDMVSRLGRGGVLKPTADRLRRLLLELETARYGGAREDPPVDQWAEETQQLFGEIDKRLKRGKGGTKTNVARLIPLVLLAVSPLLDAADATGELAKRGAEAYYQNRLDEAEQIYKTLLEKEVVSGDLHYNLGNIAYRQGKIGGALVHYERALRLMPRDADLRANRAFVERKRSARYTAESLWERTARKLFFWTETVTLSEAFWIFNLLSGIFWVAAFLVLLTGKLGFKRIALVGAVLWIVFGASVWFKDWCEREGGWAYVTVSEITVHPTFLERDKVLQKIPEGNRLRLLAEHDISGEKWLMVSLSGGRRGWVLAPGLEVL